jgi:hypothetical protein
MRKLLLMMFILYLGIHSGDAQIFQKGGLRHADRGSVSKSSNRRKEVKVREPRSVMKAKKKQEAQDRQIKREYNKYIKWSRKRTLDIQTPEVQARMKKDRKDAASRDKAKKKIVKAGSKKAGRKYK